MEDESRPSDKETFLEEIDGQQKRTVWSDRLGSGRSNPFFGKGDPNAPLVRRKGDWIAGLILILLGVGILEVDFKAALMHKSLFAAIIAIMFIAQGVRLVIEWISAAKS
jgi:hypothetical protein